MEPQPQILFVRPWRGGIDVRYELAGEAYERRIPFGEFSDEMHHLFNVALAAYRELEGAVERAGYGRRGE